ncbi:MAG: hypothetical protein IJZ28_02770 [Clostridia bacterium]|nr:hypothetical protein [Clostridia bacterium]
MGKLIRIVLWLFYFIFFGAWAGLLCFILGLLCSITIVLIPLGNTLFKIASTLWTAFLR